MKSVIVACMLASLMPGVCLAQSPVGVVAGVVRDPSGAVVAAATVRAVSATTGQMRATTTAERGEYSFPALLPGQYQISVEAAGFERTSGAATVHAGTTTRADLALRVGVLSD